MRHQRHVCAEPIPTSEASAAAGRHGEYERKDSYDLEHTLACAAVGN